MLVGEFSCILGTENITLTYPVFSPVTLKICIRLYFSILQVVSL